jgi:ATP-dependent metalloprotease
VKLESLKMMFNQSLRYRLYSSFNGLGRITDLARAAEKDPSKEFLLLRELNRLSSEGPRKVIERVERGRRPVDDNVFREYIKAIVSTGRVDDPSLNLSQLVSSTRSTVPEATPTPAAAPSSSSVWRSLSGIPIAVVKFLTLSFILVAGWSIVMESASGNLAQKMGQQNKTFEPVEATNVSMEDVKGCDEVKDELKEIIQYLKDPAKFTRLGARLPKGMLLSGPPGTGKTLLARAIAGEANVAFFQASGSDFEEMFVGVGAKRIRDLFAAARKAAPCIVFIDEIDAVASKRNARDQSSVRMTLNQLLVELDGFKPNEGIVVICATNLPESLDRALTRPGRLDKTVVVPLPDLKGRREILQLYADKVKLSPSVDLDILARRTSGMSGADLYNILNIAAVRASMDGLSSIPMIALEEAFDRVVVGLERRNPMSEQERIMTAFHEGGHALVSMNLKGADPVHKATIMPRGEALGVTWQIPEGPEKYSTKLFELKARLAVLMGGKAAEDIQFGSDNVTAGCVSDLQQASNIARRMVMQFGMGNPSNSFDEAGHPILAPIYLNETEYAYLSDSAKAQVDTSVSRLLSEAYATAYDILKANNKHLKNLSECLVEFETLSKQEIDLAIAGKVKEIRRRRKSEEKARQAEKEKLRIEQQQTESTVPVVDKHQSSTS